MGRFVHLFWVFLLYVCGLLSVVFPSRGFAVEFAFENGNKLLSPPGVHIIYFQKTGDEKKLLLRGKAIEFPGQQATVEDSVRIYPTPSQRVVVLKTGKGVYAITQDGKIETVQMNPQFTQFDGRVNPPKKIHHKGRDYLIVRLKRTKHSGFQELLFDENAKVHELKGRGGDIELRAIELIKKLVKSSASSTKSSSKGIVLSFANGNKLRGDPSRGGVSFETGKKTTEITKATWNFPDENDELNRIGFFESKDEGFWFVLDSGKAVRIPANYSLVEKSDEGGYSGHFDTLEHGGREYLLVSLPYDDDKGEEATGEVFIVRDDGEFFRVAYDQVDLTENDASIDNGILSHSDIHRKIDLNCFEGEARFHVRFPRRVEDLEGEKIEDPVQAVFDRYPDLAELIRTGGESVFELQDTSTVRDMRIGLQKKEARSLAVLGPSGSGKTELVRGFIAGIVQGKFPEIPRTIRVPIVDATGLGQGTRYVGSIESHARVIAEAAGQIPCLVFVDEMHSLRGSGTHEGNSNDVFTFWKTDLASGALQLLGTTTHPEFRFAVGSDTALERRFTKVRHKSPSKAKLPTYVRSWLKRFGKPELSDSLIGLAITLSNRFNVWGNQPGKTTDFLDLVFATQSVDGGKITKKLFIETAQRMYGVDRVHFSKRLRQQQLIKLPEALARNVVGQLHLKQAIFQLMRQYYSNVHDPKRPPVRILVVGPPGVGKTESAIVLAKTLKTSWSRIEMNRFAFSAPSEFLDEVATILKADPFAVLVLDEFEKASLPVQEALLALLDSGVFSVSEQLNSTTRGVATVPVSARHATIIATSNAGCDSRFFTERQGQTGALGFAQADWLQTFQQPLDLEEIEKLKEVVIAGGISAPVLDRFQRVVPAFSPSKDEFSDVLLLHLERTVQRIGKRLSKPVHIGNSTEFVAAFSERYYRPGMSNRTALGIIETHFQNPLAELLLEDLEGEELNLTFDNKDFKLSCSDIISAES